ncbi:ribonuclease Z [Microtetraspora sp. NBRC 13810]|nr:ribonuclease Z [Microtetraspora sp. NBRC 13810]
MPTRHRNHNGYLLRWDGEGFLFDPGEGTQRQMLLAGVSAHDLTWICVTHLHGDHSLGLPGVIQRVARDGVPHPIAVAYPATGEEYYRRLRHATSFLDTAVVTEHPLTGPRPSLPAGPLTLTARPLSHSIDTYGYRLDEPGGRRMLPDRLGALGVHGPLVGRLQREGVVTTPAGVTVTLDECSEPRPGQSFAFVMDTRLCDNAYALAEGADLLVIESTFLSAEAELAERYGHLTAAQAGHVAARAGAGHLVLTHVSERYDAADEPRFLAEAATTYPGPITLAHDLQHIPFPRPPRPTATT